MNLKKFFKTFITATLILVGVLAVIFGVKLALADIGSGKKSEALDEYQKAGRKNILEMGTD